jgi:hypothetical protein
MGISVADYFAQKEACPHCVEHDNEEHCVTTLLSRRENCFFYNAVQMRVWEYTESERALARNVRDSMTEEQLVDYYVRGENVIQKIKLFDLPYYEQFAIVSRINYLYVRDIIEELKSNDKQKVQKMVDNMLTEIEKEYP